MHGRSIYIRYRDIKKLMEENPEEYVKQLKEDKKDLRELLKENIKTAKLEVKKANKRLVNTYRQMELIK